MVWVYFFLCVAVILFAGMKLAVYADAIAEKTGLGRLWVGFLLLGFVTSMPELVTTISSVVLVGLPDLALGTLFGSSAFNLVILAILDAIYRRNPLLSQVSRIHMLSAGMGIILMAVTVFSILGEEALSGLTLGWVGLPTILIIVLYVAGIRLMFSVERKRQSASAESETFEYSHFSIRSAYFKFALAALAIIGAGIWLSYVGDELATTYNWSASFVGSLFLAITTSLPELAVTIGAIRLGALDMAVADILGANMINTAKIFIADLVFTQGPILSSVSNAHTIMAGVGIVMSIIVIIGLRFRPKRKTFGVVSWYGPVLIGLYIFGAFALFNSGI